LHFLEILGQVCLAQAFEREFLSVDPRQFLRLAIPQTLVAVASFWWIIKDLANEVDDRVWPRAELSNDLKLERLDLGTVSIDKAVHNTVALMVKPGTEHVAFFQDNELVIVFVVEEILFLLSEIDRSEAIDGGIGGGI
jgi:hypothetical protein